MAVCLSAWVWVCLAEMLCVSQDKLVFVRSIHKTQSASQNDIFGKNGKGACYVAGTDFWICVGLQQPTSSLCLSVSHSLS